MCIGQNVAKSICVLVEIRLSQRCGIFINTHLHAHLQYVCNIPVKYQEGYTECSRRS